MHARLKLILGWEPETSELYIREALKLNPNSIDAHSHCGDLMAMFGRYTETLLHVNQILALDPLSLLSVKQVARIFYKLGRFDDTIAHLNDAIEMEPTDYESLLLLGAAYAEKGEYNEAVRMLRKSYRSHQTIESLSMIGYVEARKGRRERSRQIIGRIQSDLQDHKEQAVNLARIYLAMGEKEKTYYFLEKAYQQHALEMYALEYDPRWKEIRAEPRFESLIVRVKNSADFTKSEDA
jgi:tetratricopeptide (TPR) repeat protein